MFRAPLSVPLPLARRLVQVVFGESSPTLAAWVASSGAILQDDLSPADLELVLTEALREAFSLMKATFGRTGFKPADCGPLLLVTIGTQVAKLRNQQESGTAAEAVPAPPPEQTDDAPTGETLPPDDEAVALFAAGRRAGLAGMLTREELEGVKSDWLAGYHEGCREAERNTRAAAEQAAGRRGRADRRKLE